MKRLKQATAILLAITILLPTFTTAAQVRAAQAAFQTVHTEEGSYVLTDEAGQETVVDEAWEDDYPYGLFALGHNQVTAAEGGDTITLTVYRLGGTQGKASAIIQYLPAVVNVSEEAQNTDYAISADDITLELEDAWPITKYQPWGALPAPEPANTGLLSQPGKDGEGSDCLLLSPRISGTPTDYTWEVLADGVWEEVELGESSELPVSSEDLNTYDFRCIYTLDGVRYCTDSYKGAAYEKPEPEVLPTPPADLELNPEPTFTEIDLNGEEGPYGGWLLEVCFAQGETEKDIRITAVDDDLPELAEMGTFTITDHFGGDIHEAMNTASLRVADNDEDKDAPSQIGFTVSEAVFDKSNGTAALTVRREGGVVLPMTVEWRILAGSAQPGVDYADASGQLQFYGVQTEQTIIIDLINDQVADDTYKDFTVELSELKGDAGNGSRITEDTCTVQLYNSNTGEALNLASSLAATDAVDVSADVTETDPASVSAAVITGTQVPREEPQEADVPMLMSYDYSSGVTFTNKGSWDSTVTEKLFVSSDGSSPSTHSKTISNMWALYKSFSATITGGADFASGWDRLWHGDKEYAYTYFEWNPYSKSNGYKDCSPKYSKDGIHINLNYYSKYYVDDAHDYSTDTGTITVGVKKYESQCSEDDIDSAAEVKFTRRTFQDFALTLHTANDENTSVSGAAQFSQADYQNIIQSVTVTNGGLNGNKLYVGSTVDVVLGDTHLTPTAAYITDASGNRVFTGTVRSGSTGSTATFSNIILDPAKKYTFNVVLDRRQEVNIDVSTSAAVDAAGNYPDGALDDAYALLCSRASGLTLGYTAKDSTGNFPTSGVSLSETTVSYANRELVDSRLRITGIDNIQYLNFNLPETDAIVFNGKVYDGNADIWLSLADIKTKSLHFYFYAQEFKEMERPMQATLDATALYLDTNGNGRIDGYFDTASGSFVLTAVGDATDQFICYLEGDFEESMYAPMVDDKGKAYQYFLRPYYTANPVALTAPDGASENDMMQVLPAIVTDVTDPTAYAALTTQQKQYRYLVSGISQIGESGTPAHTSDNHAKYGAAASAYSYVDMPLGGPVSESLPVTSDKANGTEITYDGRACIVYNGFVYEYDENAPEGLGIPVYQWTPNYSGNLLYPFAQPEAIVIPESAAGTNFPVTEDVTNAWRSLADGSVTATAPADESQYVKLQVGTGTGITDLNNYLGSFGSNDTFSLLVREQKQTTGDILSAQGTRTGTADSPVKETITRGNVGSYPTSESLLIASGSGIPSDKVTSDDKIAYKEAGVDAMPAFGIPADIANIVAVTMGGYEIGFSIGIPVSGTIREKNKVKTTTNGTTTTSWEKNPDVSKWSIGSNTRYAHDRFKAFRAAKAAGQGGQWAALYGEELTANSLFSRSLSYDARLSLGFTWKYDAMENQYLFSEGAVTLAGGISYRLSYRFTPFPVAYIFVTPGVDAAGSMGLQVDRLSTTNESLLKGNKLTLKETGNTITYAPLTETGKPDTNALSYLNQISFVTNYKMLELEFDGSLYVECYYLDDQGNPTNKAPSGFSAGFLRSQGKKPVTVTLAKSDNAYIDDGNQDKKVIVYLTALTYGKGNDTAEDTTISSIREVTGTKTDYSFSGLEIEIGGTLEAGGGIGIELLKFELFFKGNATIGFAFGRGAGGEEVESATFDSFLTTVAIGFRAAIMWLNFGMDLINYSIGYNVDKDLNGQSWQEIDTSGWYHTWSAFNGMMDGDEWAPIDPLTLKAAAADMGITITLPNEVRAQAYSNGVNSREPLLPQVKAFDSNAGDFQVSGYGSSVNAFKLLDGTQTGHDYQIVTADGRNYVLYTGTRGTGETTIDNTQLWLSLLEETDDVYGLVNPIAQKGDAETPYITLDDDEAGDLDFYAWADGSVIHAVWVSFVSETKANQVDDDALQDTLAKSAHNTVVKYASFDTADADSTGFSKPIQVSDPRVSTHYFQPHVAGSSGSHALVYAQSIPYTAAEKAERLAQYETYLDTVLPASSAADPDGVLDATRSYRLNYQKAMLSVYGGSSRLSVAIPKEDGSLITGTVDVNNSQSHEIITSLEMAEAGGIYYLAYATQQDTFNGPANSPTDIISTHRLYLRTLTVSGDTVTWGDPYLLRTLVNYEENDRDAAGAVKEGIYSGGSLTAPYTDPYFANLKFLTGKIGDGLSGQDEDFSVLSLLGGSEPEEETFLLFEMNGDTYVIRENSLESITTEGNGQIIPFFTADDFYAAEGYDKQDTVDAKAAGLSLSSGKSEVVIGADGDGNLAAVYTSSVPNTVNNAIYLAYWDATTSKWSNGVILAMNYLDVYEASVAEGWDAETTEAAYFSREQGGGMTQFLFSNLQIALGRSQAQAAAESGTGDNKNTEETSAEELYKNGTILDTLKTILRDHGVTAVDVAQWLADDPANRTIDPALREEIANSLAAYRLKQAAESQQINLDTGDTAAAPELLILTQGALQQLVNYTYTDPDGKTQTMPAPRTGEDGTMVPAQVGIYAISYGKGQQQVGEAAIAFGDYDYSAGAELRAAVSFRNVGDAAIRGSENNPITVRLMLYDEGVKTELAQWKIKQNIGSSQTVQLTTDNRCAPLPADLGYGDYFYLTVEEDEAYVTASGGTAYLYDSATDPDCAYRLPVAHRPELSVEGLTGKVHSVNKDGSVNIEVDFDVANRGSRRAKDTFVQFAFFSGLDENGEPIYTPLDITNNTLKVSQQQAIVQSGGEDPLKIGVLRLSTSDSYYSDDYYLTPEEYNTRRSAFYSTTAVSGWDSARYQGSTYWYNPAYETLKEAYTAAQAALSMWNYDDEADMYYKDGYSSYKTAKEASDEARKQEYILTEAEYNKLPAEEKASWHEASDKAGTYIPIAFQTCEGAELVWKLACQDSGQNIFSHFYRNVRGTITVSPSQFKGIQTGSLDLRVGVYSAGSEASLANGLYISDHSDEYHAANNYSHVQLEHTGFIYAMPKAVLNPNTLNLLPVSIRTTTGKQPQITVMEVPEEGGTPNLSTLYYTTNGTSAPYNVSVGSLAVIPDASGSGTIHIMDEATNTTFAITYTIDGAAEGEAEEDAINVGTDNPGLIFSKKAEGDTREPWQFVTAADGGTTPYWQVNDANYRLYKGDVAVGQPGASFTFWTTASRLDFYLLGDVTVKSSKFTKEAVSVTGSKDSYCKSVTFDNPTGESHLVTVTVTGEKAASLDKIVPSYGSASTKPSQDANLPDLYWNRDFPADGSLKQNDTVALTVYAVDKEGLASLYRNGNSIPAGQITKTDDGLWSYTFTVTANTDIVTIKAEDTAGYTVSHTLVTDNWYGGTAGDTKLPGSLTFNAEKADDTKLNDENGNPIKEVYLLNGETAALTADAHTDYDTLTYYRYDTETAAFVELPSAEITENGYYMVEAQDKSGGTHTGPARRILWIDAFEQQPTLAVTTEPIKDPTDDRVIGYTVTWNAGKDKASTYGLQSVTVNGAELLTASGAYEATGSFTIPYGGEYKLTVTDGRGIKATETLTLTVPVYLPDKAVTYEHAWGQPTETTPASNGSFTIDFGQVTGGYYDRDKITDSEGKALMPEDYSGSYQYVVLHPDGELAGSLIPDGENPPTPEQLKEWKEKILNDWKDKLTWTAISTDSDRYTIDNLYAGKNVVLIRDTSNPATTPKEADAAIEITYAELLDISIDVVSLSSRSAVPTLKDGEVSVIAGKGHTGQYEFAILPGSNHSLVDFKAGTVEWQQADEDSNRGTRATFTGLDAGTYQVAVRALYTESDAYDSSTSPYWNGVAISHPVEVIDATTQAPTLAVTTTPITDPTDTTENPRVIGYRVNWTAAKHEDSDYGLQSVTVNGAELLTVTGLDSDSGSFTIPYGGEYTFEVTDGRGISGEEKTLNLTVPVYLPDSAVTYEHAWGQPAGDKPASNGSFTIDFGQVTGGYYDTARTKDSEGKALLPEDYSGKYQYVVLHPGSGEIAQGVKYDGTTLPTLAQVQAWAEDKWKEVPTDTNGAYTTTTIPPADGSGGFTDRDLYAGKHAVVIRDTSPNAESLAGANAAIEITCAELMDAAIDVVSLSARRVADANAADGEVYVTAANGHTGRYEFAILPDSGHIPADFQSDTVIWQQADEDNARGTGATLKNLTAGTYQVAVRAHYAESNAYDTNPVYWNGMAISQPVEVKVGAGSSIEAVPSRASSASAANGSVTAFGKSSGTEPVYFQYAILPLESEEAAKDFSGDISGIADLNLTWYFADDLSDPQQAMKFANLTAGWYQVFVRAVYDGNELVSPTLTAQLNALAQSEDPTTANSNQDLLMAAQNAYDKAPGNYLTAAYTTVRVAVTPSSGGGTSTITVPISGDENTIHVDATVSGDTAVIGHVDLSALDTVIGDDVDTGVVTIDFSGLNKALTTVVLPAETIKEIADAVTDPANDAESLEIIFTDGTSIEFDAEALGEKSAQADALDITISIRRAKDSPLTDAQISAIGNHLAYDITVTSGGEPITDMGGKVTIHVPYSLRPGETPYGITVFYVDETGGKEACHTSYDSVKKRVNWKTNHLSVYMIDYDPAFLTGCPKDDTCPIFPFTDADTGAWYHDGIHFCVEEGLMNGVAETAFAPNGTTSRAMIVTILHRLEGAPAAAGSENFHDVADDAWYGDAVRWAAETGIVNGYGNGAFGPNDPITREQMAAIFWRYAGYKGIDVSRETDLSGFEDAADVSSYAVEPLQWACGVGLIQGMESGTGMILDPQGDATRAQAATIIMRLCTGIL